MDTPSGMIKTSLDKMILEYAAKGYEWMDRAKATYYNPASKEAKHVKESIEWLTQSDDDVVFVKDGSVIVAEAILNEDTNHITGYNMNVIKSTEKTA